MLSKPMFSLVRWRHQALSSCAQTGLCGCLVALCLGCSGVNERQSAAQQGVPDALARQDPAQQSSLHTYLQQLANRFGVCHVAMAVVRNREILTVDAAQGCATEVPTQRDSIFQAASLSKPIFAYAVLKLVQQGKINLDAPVLAYLPQGYVHRQVPYRTGSPTDPVSDPKLAAVTVRMVLNHSCGLPNWANGPLVFDHAPGTRWQYSGEGYVLLQRAVEAVTGEKLDTFMQRQVFTPLGMTHSAYTDRPELAPYVVPGRARDGTLLKSVAFQSAVAAFTLYTSAQDYGRFLAALMKDDAALRQIVDSPVVVQPKLNLSWGLGWGLEQTPEDLFLWHWGNNPGYRAFAMVSPRSGDGFVMLSNSEAGLALVEPLSKLVFPGTHPVFRFHLLRDGLASLLCETMDICV